MNSEPAPYHCNTSKNPGAQRLNESSADKGKIMLAVVVIEVNDNGLKVCHELGADRRIYSDGVYPALPFYVAIHLHKRRQPQGVQG